MNWIEAEFTALRYFTVDGSDQSSHAEQKAAIAGYIRSANTSAEATFRSRVQRGIRAEACSYRGPNH